MHYLFATWDGGGTVPVELGVARRLVARGHTVTVLADPTLAEQCDRAGAELVAWRRAPHRRSTALEDDVIKDWECRNPVQLFRRLSQRLITGPAAAFAEETLHEARRRPPDIAVVSAAVLGPMVATEALGIPTVAICANIYPLPAPGMPPFGLGLEPAGGPLGRARDRALNAVIRAAWRSGLPALNAARAEHGLSALTDPWDQLRSCHSTVVTTARAFDFPAELPPGVHYVGPVLDDPSWAADPARPGLAGDPVADLGWSADDAGLPLVVVGVSGTYVSGQDEMLRRIVAALATLPVRGLVCTGPTIDPDDVPDAARVRVVRAAPHSQVFPRARVVVTHGGHGTIMKALAAGKPVLCMPGGRDQKDNAVRLTVRGAGLSVRSDAGPAVIAGALRRLLDEPRFAVAAEDLARRIRAETDDESLTRALEQPGRQGAAS